MTKELDFIDIGIRIKAFRLRKDISQMELAKMLGVSQTHMSNIERGRAGITIENLVKMSNIFQCSMDVIIFGEEKANPNLDDMDEFLEAYQLFIKIKSMK